MLDASVGPFAQGSLNEAPFLYEFKVGRLQGRGCYVCQRKSVPRGIRNHRIGPDLFRILHHRYKVYEQGWIELADSSSQRIIE